MIRIPITRLLAGAKLITLQNAIATRLASPAIVGLLYVFGHWSFPVSAATGNASPEDARLEQFFRDYLEARFRVEPFYATRTGDHRFDHLMDDLSRDGRKKTSDLLKQTRRDLPKQIAYAKLSRAGQIDFEVLDHELETELWLDENTRPYERDPRIYNQYISDSVFLLFAQSRLPKETNVANAIGRIREIPKIVTAARATLNTPPQVVLETAIRQNRGSIGFYERGIFEMIGQTSQKAQLELAAAEVLPALRDYSQFLEKLLPKSTGEWRLGKRKFAKKLELTLDAGVSAEKVLADATAEFARVRTAMHTISRQLWARYFAGKPFPAEDTEDGHREAIQQVLHAVNQEHGRPEELVKDAHATVERIKAFIKERDILRLPDPDRCQVIEMPEFQRGNAVAYLNSAPPLDPDAPSLYAISPPMADWDARRVATLLEEYNSHMLQILTIHEAYPGHYVQLEYSNRSGSLIRRVLQSGVYVEGWAVYTEQTMLDQGYGDGDPRMRLMQLKFYLRAVGNAILDHKMHCTQMSDDEAFRFLTQDAFQSEEEARQKIVRAKQTSVQLSTYFVGRMAMHRLREAAQVKTGSNFNLGRFHESILNQGSVPVKYLPELVLGR